MKEEKRDIGGGGGRESSRLTSRLTKWTIRKGDKKNQKLYCGDYFNTTHE